MLRSRRPQSFQIRAGIGNLSGGTAAPRTSDRAVVCAINASTGVKTLLVPPVRRTRPRAPLLGHAGPLGSTRSQLRDWASGGGELSRRATTGPSPTLGHPLAR